MKQQIARFSLHQNAKVVAIISAVWSLIFLIPFILITNLAMPAQHAPLPWYMLLILPVVYLIFGYVFTVVGCVVYNFCSQYIGGFEFEAGDQKT
jgi:uncharacterized membrane protein YhaH (DUF805 family)